MDFSPLLSEAPEVDVLISDEFEPLEDYYSDPPWINGNHNETIIY
ncbi:hypothetical protein ACIGBL_34450 [Streptomyces sp. NPDC085614]